MSKKYFSSSFLYLSIVLSGLCQASPPDAIVRSFLNESLQVSDVISERKILASDIVDEVVLYLSEVNCPSQHPDCNMSSVNFSDGLFDDNKGDPKEVVLIIDSGLEFHTSTRYRSRVIEYYKLNNSGHLQQYDPTIEISTHLYKVLKRLDGYSFDGSSLQADPFIPASWFSSLVDDLSSEESAYNKHLIPHGTLPLMHLMEHNPNARFVAVNEENLFFKYKDEFCSKNLFGFKEKIDTAATSMRTLIANHNVKYINASWGYSRDVIKKTWDQVCGGIFNSLGNRLADRFNAVLNSYYDSIFNYPGVLSVQATDVFMTEANNKLDIDTRFKNRIRVGAYNVLDSGVTDTGELKDKVNGMYPQLPNFHPFNNTQWIDIFVNFGFIKPRPFPYNSSPLMDYNVFATSAFPINYIHPSWAAPVALSRAIHVKNTLYPDLELTNELIQKMKADMTPSQCSDWELQQPNESICKIQDPLFHQQAEVFRLGYLDRIDDASH